MSGPALPPRDVAGMQVLLLMVVFVASVDDRLYIY
jgi:hypothetical protein